VCSGRRRWFSVGSTTSAHGGDGIGVKRESRSRQSGHTGGPVVSRLALTKRGEGLAYSGWMGNPGREVGRQAVRIGPGAGHWGPVALGIALLCSLFIAACTSSGGDMLRTPSPTGTGVPDVRGVTTTEADRTLQGAGLLLQVDPVGGSDSVVIDQSPEPGAPVPADSTVLVQARCYPAPCPFPGEGKVIYDPCTCAAR
jgi:hypothetical protein